MAPSATTFHESKHLAEEELGALQGRCLFCDSEGRVAVTRLQRAPDVDLMKCRSCGACSASRIPTVAALESYYNGYYERPEGELAGDSQVTFRHLNRFARHLAGVVQLEVARGPLEILDFGGGDGAISLRMAEQLLAAGYPQIDITVVEYQDEVAESSNDAIVMRHQPDLDALAGREGGFDVVLASAIVEHLPDPKVESERLLELLRPGGLLYIRTPFCVPVLRLMKRFGLTLDFTFPGHLHDMGQGFWEAYFSRLSPSGPHRIVRSQPSIVETAFAEHFVRTLVAHLLKLPWRILGRRYTLVGGWEVFVQKHADFRGVSG